MEKLKFVYSINNIQNEEHISENLLVYIQQLVEKIEFYEDFSEDMSDIMYNDSLKYKHMDILDFRRDIASKLIYLKESINL